MYKGYFNKIQEKISNSNKYGDFYFLIQTAIIIWERNQKTHEFALFVKPRVSAGYAFVKHG